MGQGEFVVHPAGSQAARALMVFHGRQLVGFTKPLLMKRMEHKMSIDDVFEHISGFLRAREIGGQAPKGRDAVWRGQGRNVRATEGDDALGPRPRSPSPRRPAEGNSQSQGAQQNTTSDAPVRPQTGETSAGQAASSTPQEPARSAPQQNFQQ